MNISPIFIFINEFGTVPCGACRRMECPQLIHYDVRFPKQMECGGGFSFWRPNGATYSRRHEAQIADPDASTTNRELSKQLEARG